MEYNELMNIVAYKDQSIFNSALAQIPAQAESLAILIGEAMRFEILLRSSIIGNTTERPRFDPNALQTNIAEYIANAQTFFSQHYLTVSPDIQGADAIVTQDVTTDATPSTPADSAPTQAANVEPATDVVEAATPASPGVRDMSPSDRPA